MVGVQCKELVPPPWCDGPLPWPGWSGQLSGLDRGDGVLGPSFTAGPCTRRVKAKPMRLVCDAGRSRSRGRARLDRMPALAGCVRPVAVGGVQEWRVAAVFGLEPGLHGRANGRAEAGSWPMRGGDMRVLGEAGLRCGPAVAEQHSCHRVGTC